MPPSWRHFFPNKNCGNRGILYESPKGILSIIRLRCEMYSYEEFKYDYKEMVKSRSRDLKEFEQQYPEYTQRFKAERKEIYRDFFNS